MSNRDAIGKGIAAGKQEYLEAHQEAEAARLEKINSPRYDGIRQVFSALVSVGYVVGIHDAFSRCHPLDWILTAAGIYGIITFMQPPFLAKGKSRPEVKGQEPPAT